MITAVIVPTYKEKDNIERLLESIIGQTNLLRGVETHIVVVDGNSPDGTWQIVQELAKSNPKIHLIVEQKKGGLGQAYNTGMHYAMHELNADALVEMDADFQHDPKDLPRLISKFEEGYDYVIGSRYIKGGSIPKQWELYRKFLSWSGNLFSRVVLGLWNVNDVTSGYRISRSSVIAKINLDKLEKKAYAYKLQLLYEVSKVGGKITEIPIQFGLRDRGDSKMELENMIHSFKTVIKSRVLDNLSFFKFLIIGLLGLFVQTSIYYVLVLFFNAPPQSALLVPFALAASTTFIGNNIWSFSDRKITNPKTLVSKFVIFLVINIGTYLIQHGCIAFAEQISGGSKLVILLVGYPLGINFGMVWNYLCYSRVVWKSSKPRV